MNPRCSLRSHLARSAPLAAAHSPPALLPRALLTACAFAAGALAPSSALAMSAPSADPSLSAAADRARRARAPRGAA